MSAIRAVLITAAPTSIGPSKGYYAHHLLPNYLSFTEYNRAVKTSRNNRAVWLGLFGRYD
eukprot:scaffold28774_cov23-Cyclotella_meneghiniana.AAC.1